MRVAKTVSITLPPELLVKAQAVAVREHRTMSELFREALRRYISEKPAVDREKWRELLEYGRAKGRELGVATEADVERMANEYRASKRA
jgi:Arc/MetJ-type ribon-helix-helix transcriptional regulator